MAQVFSSAAHREAGRAKMATILKSCRCRFASVTRLGSIGFGPARSCWIDALVGD
jgi:hypothetical protein